MTYTSASIAKVHTSRHDGCAAFALSLLNGCSDLLAIEVDIAQRRGYLCMNMLGVFFAMAALPGSGDRPFLCCMAVWAMTDLCSLRNRRPRKQEEV